MARQLSTTLHDLAVCVRDMRALGIASWAGSPVGDLALGPDPKKTKLAEDPKDPLAQRRRYFAELLGRPVSDEELKNFP